MKRRLYFILPDVRTARKVYRELLLSHVDDQHMHVIAKEETALHGLPEANLWQKSDIVHGTQQGLVIGGLTGAALGIAAVLGSLVPETSAGLIILSIALAGALIGAWASSMIALAVPNTRLEPFREDLAKGHILFLVEVPPGRVEEISRKIRRHHPDADAHGVEPTIPAFP